MRQNCWEFNKCDRELGGQKTKEFGVCPAAREERLNGIHNGKNAGRACWVISGTFCKGKAQGTFAEKKKSCFECDFYKKVREEEFPDFILLSNLLKIIRS